MGTLSRLGRWLYPCDDKNKWAPLIWLPFMFWFFAEPGWKHASPLVWIGNTAFGLVFVYLYLYAFSRPEPRRFYAILAMLAMATIAFSFNDGSVGLFIYTVAAAGFSINFKRVISFVAIEIAILAFYIYRLHLPFEFWGSMVLLLVLVGFGNHHWAVKHCQERKLSLANDEIEHLAKVAERERIARDLHDLLGHTLSVITLKSELARKLVDCDPERAKHEMLEVEVTSRAALADVREAITGYRSGSIFAELARARATLETAGVKMESDAKPVELTPAQESVLSLALREAVTNVVRHAGAQNCMVRLQAEPHQCTLEVADDGCGKAAPEGNGLRGMRERLQSVGGSLVRETSLGTRLIIQMPLVDVGLPVRSA